MDKSLLWARHRSNLELAKLFASASISRLKKRGLFNDVQTFCMFLGYPRSGHSLIGSLLDAHRHMVIAHELNTLKFVSKGFGRRLIYPLLVDNAEAFSSQLGRQWTGYFYEVPNQWQGRFQTIRVIGDKKGGGATRHLRRRPGLLQRVQKVVGVKLKFIHVMRNPYDNITTISRKHNMPHERAIEHYFRLCETILSVKEKVPATDILDVHLADFIRDPKGNLKTMCEFLGVEAAEDYLEDCAGIVFDSPKKSRNQLPWSPQVIAQVQEQINHVPYLGRYTYES